MPSITRRSFLVAALASLACAPSALAAENKTARGENGNDAAKTGTKTARVGTLTLEYPADWPDPEAPGDESPHFTVGPVDGGASVMAQRMDGWDCGGLFGEESYMAFVTGGFAQEMGYGFGEPARARDGGVSWSAWPFTAKDGDGEDVSGTFLFAFAGADLYLVLATAGEVMAGQVGDVLASVAVDGRRMPGGDAGTDGGKGPAKAAAPSKPQDMTDRGPGEMRLSTPGGTTEGGNVPKFGVHGASVYQIGIEVSGVGPSRCAVLVDGEKAADIEATGGLSQSTLNLTGAMLDAGTHTVELASEDGAVHKAAQYEITAG